jgi:hypothetical protein
MANTHTIPDRKLLCDQKKCPRTVHQLLRATLCEVNASFPAKLQSSMMEGHTDKLNLQFRGARQVGTGYDGDCDDSGEGLLPLKCCCASPDQ